LANIATLNVVLSASTTKFVAGLATGQSALNGFVGVVSSCNAAVIGFGAAIAGVMAAGGLSSMVKGTINAIDETKDLASKLSITTDALTALNYVATLNGSSAEALANAFGFMNKNLGAAVAGDAKKVAEALASIGLSAKQLTSMAPDKAFLEIAEGISKITNPYQQAAAAQDIFGKGGKEILNVLRMGKVGIAEYMAEAQRLGIVLTQIDAEKAGAAKDELDRLGFVIGGIKNKLAAELSPYIQAAAKHFSELAGKGGGAGKFITDAVQNAANAAADLVDVIDLIRAGWNLAMAAAAESTALFLESLNIAGQVTNVGLEIGLKPFGNFKKIPNLRPLIDKFHAAASADLKESKDLFGRDASSGVANFFAAIVSGAQKAAAAAAAAKPKLQAIPDAIAKSGPGITAILQRMREGFRPFFKDLGADMLKDAKKKWEDLKDQGRQVYEASRTPLQKYQDDLANLNKLLANGAISQETFNRAAAAAKLDMQGGPFQMPGAPASVSRNIARGSERASSGVVGKGIDIVAKEAPKQTAKLGDIVTAVRDLVAKIVPTETVGIP
jgi:hypothetical protein